MLSRAFTLPGELPAMTHLGCTLFRHCFHAAWRYTSYHLGRSVPERSRVVVVHLRPYFEGSRQDPLDDLVLEPGAERRATMPVRMAAALAFHRLRLSGRRKGPFLGGDGGGTAPGSWPDLRRRVSGIAAQVGEAMLADLIAVRRRRAARASGRRAAPCSSPRTAIRLTEHLPLDLDFIADDAGVRRNDDRPPRADPARGAFRDAWIEIVADLRPRVLALGSSAVSRGLIEEPEDAFFLPFDHLDVLAADSAPAWLDAAVASNRAEWSGLAESEAPPESLQGRVVGVRLRPAGSRTPAARTPLP